MCGCERYVGPTAHHGTDGGFVYPSGYHHTLAEQLNMMAANLALLMKRKKPRSRLPVQNGIEKKRAKN
jgi:hypothetical protein